MASTVEPEYKSSSTPIPAPAPAPAPATATAGVDYFKFDVILRFLLFASSLVSVVVMVTSKQTIYVPQPLSAKFRYSPAFVYFVAAFSVSGLYSIITTLASLSAIKNPTLRNKLLLHYVLWDALILGIIASAVGTAGGIAYLGLKGNRHVTGWNKICNVFDDFCRHVGSAIAVGLFGSIVTLLLIGLSAYSIHSRLPK